jgi:hypothetical protein
MVARPGSHRGRCRAGCRLTGRNHAEEEWLSRWANGRPTATGLPITPTALGPAASLQRQADAIVTSLDLPQGRRKVTEVAKNSAAAGAGGITGM